MLNKEISANLENYTRTLYDYWFLQFEIPNENGKPYKSSGGKMLWNVELKREIPEGWNQSTLAIVSNMYQPKTFDAKLLDDKGLYRVYGAGGYMGKFNEYNHEKRFLYMEVCGNVYK